VSALVVDALLAVAVLCVWLGCAGFVRLRAPLDRLHCVAFVNVTSATALTLAGFVADGFSSRSLKILAIAVLVLLAGAAGTHVMGRAFLLRAER
jgi:multisubunit Na+/H+ antiporter MnhG subunit